jgi:hypothetical protein
VAGRWFSRIRLIKDYCVLIWFGKNKNKTKKQKQKQKQANKQMTN